MTLEWLVYSTTGVTAGIHERPNTRTGPIREEKEVIIDAEKTIVSVSFLTCHSC